MATVKINDWWKAKEIPLAESDWRNIKLYCERGDDGPWRWADAVYFFRLAPPFTVGYSHDRSSPLIYIGRGALEKRWQSHLRNWIGGLSHWLPGARYELWAFQGGDRVEEIESDALKLFLDTYGKLPLANRVGGKKTLYNEYPEIHEVAEDDRRHWWSITPKQPIVREYFLKGSAEDEDNG